MSKVYKNAGPDRLAGADILIAGLFSAKRKDHEAVMTATAALATARGGRVVGQVVQRRGVSHGGVAVMDQPFSRQTLFGSGKVREIAELCQRGRIGAVVLVNALTDPQRRTLEARFGCPVLSRAELEPPNAPQPQRD
ncbi:MAG: hypothetical protein HOW97_22175 [Catenulispora sp.]|nr:hypothetical protein [Catenulispora sp.]